MKVTLRFFISLCLLALPAITNAQDKFERQIFVRTGVDLSRFALPISHDFGLTGAEVSLDGEVKFHFFPILELGYNKVKNHTNLHKYDLHGNYLRFGLNYNMTNYKHRLDRNLFFVGARYAISNYSHEATEINFANNWGALQTSLPTTNLSNQWFEAVIGLRAEMIKNLYMGFTIRVKKMIFKPDYGNYMPFWIPGYGDPTKSIAFGLSYSIFYAIPIKNPKLDFEK